MENPVTGHRTGSAYALPGKDEVTRDGYVLDGWALSAEGEVAYGEGQTIQIPTADLDLYAHWAQDSVKVSYQVRLEGGSVVGKLTGPEGTGLAWTDGAAADPRGTYDSAFASSSIVHTGATQYVTSRYGVVLVFDEVTGTYTQTSQAQPYAITAVALPGYQFLYWEDSDGHRYYGNGGTLQAQPNPTDRLFHSVTYTAVFGELDPVTITYQVEDKQTGWLTKYTEVLGPLTGKPTGSTATIATGYKILGWYEGETPVSTDLSLMPQRTSGLWTTHTYTLRVQPGATTYTIRHLFQNEDGTFAESADHPAMKGIPGTTLDEVQVAKVGEDYLVRGTAEGSTYSWKPEGADSVAYVVDGYTFAPSLSKLTVALAADGSAELVLYYVSDTNAITIVYQATEGGSVQPGSEKFATLDDVLDAKGSLAAALPGYRFSNAWQLEGQTVATASQISAKAIHDAIKDKVASGTKLFRFVASFVENNKVTIRYIAGEGGTVSVDSEDVAPASGKPQGSLATADPGYQFLGWVVDATGAPVTYADGSQAPSHLVPQKDATDKVYKDITYRAVFTALTNVNFRVEHYKVDSKGNAVLARTDTYTGTTGSSVTALDDDGLDIPEKDHDYRIDTSATEGWDGYQFHKGHKGEVFETTILGDGKAALKLYYVAQKLSYTVTRYQKNGDGTITQLDTLTLEGYVDEPVRAPHSEGDIPAGYEEVADGGSITGKVAGQTDEVTYSAHLEDRVTGYVLATDGTTLVAGSILNLTQVLSPLKVGYVVNYYYITGADYQRNDTAPSPSYYKTYRTVTDQTALSGTYLVIDPIDIPGYTFMPYESSTKYPTKDRGYVTGDGQAVFNLLYRADLGHKLTFVPNPANAAGAKWQKGSEGLASSSYRTDSVTYVPTGDKLDYAGYTFDGWSKSSEATTVDYRSGDPITVGAADETILYAVWHANTNTPYQVLRFVVNGDGTVTALASTKGTYTTDQSLTPAAQAPEGYELSTTAVVYYDGTSYYSQKPADWDEATGYAYQTIQTLPIAGTGDTTFVHVFTAKSVSYKIYVWTVDPNTGAATKVDALTTETVGPAGLHIVADAATTEAPAGYVYYTKTLAANLPEGYEYLGDGVAVTNQAGTVSHTTNASGDVLGDGSQVLNIYLSAISHQLSYEPGTGSWTTTDKRQPSYRYGYQVSPLAAGANAATRSGYHLVGWTTTQAQEVTFDSWQTGAKASYTGTVTVNEAKGEEALALLDLFRADPTAYGFYALDATFTMPNHDATLYAVWEPDEVDYTIYRYALDTFLQPGTEPLSTYTRRAYVDTWQTATAEDKTYSGYHYYANTTGDKAFTRNVETIQVNAQGTGTAAIRLHFTMNKDTTYKVYAWKITGDGKREALNIFDDGKGGKTNLHIGKGFADTTINVAEDGTPRMGEATDATSSIYYDYVVVPNDSAAYGTLGYQFEKTYNKGGYKAKYQDIVDAAGNLVLDIYYVAMPRTLVYDLAGGDWTQGDKTPAVAPAAESTFNLAAYGDVRRYGYTFLGWSRTPGATAADTDLAATEGETTGPSFAMPTASATTLHAVWAPATSTYVIEYWTLSGDGTLTHRADLDLTATGTTGAKAVLPEGARDDGKVPGYAYAASVKVGETTYTSYVDGSDAGVITPHAPDATTGVLHVALYYQATEDTVYYVERWVVVGGKLLPVGKDGKVIYDYDPATTPVSAYRLEHKGAMGANANAAAATTGKDEATNTYLTVDAIDIEGFKFSGDKQYVSLGDAADTKYQTNATGQIVYSADEAGRLTLKLYYYATELPLTFAPGTGDAYSWSPKEDPSASYMAGAAVTLPTKHGDSSGKAQARRTGYLLEGWVAIATAEDATAYTYTLTLSDGTKVTKKVSDINTLSGLEALAFKDLVYTDAAGQHVKVTHNGSEAVLDFYAAGAAFQMSTYATTLYGFYLPQKVSYIVNHYKHQGDGKVVLADTETLWGYADTPAPTYVPTANKFAGYALASLDDQGRLLNDDGTIVYADGAKTIAYVQTLTGDISATKTLELSVFYEAQTVDYVVRWYKWTGAEQRVLFFEEVRHAKVDSQVSVTEADKANGVHGMPASYQNDPDHHTVDSDGTNYTPTYTTSVSPTALGISDGKTQSSQTGYAQPLDYFAELRLFFAAQQVTIHLRKGDKASWDGTEYDTIELKADFPDFQLPGSEARKAPLRSGYEFKGWYASNTCDVEGAQTDAINVCEGTLSRKVYEAIKDATDFYTTSFDLGDQDVTLYAVWYALDTTPYLVRHVRVDGDGKEVADVLVENLTGITDDDMTAVPYVATGTGKVDSRFQGWHYDATANAAAVDVDGDGTVDVTFASSWTNLANRDAQAGITGKLLFGTPKLTITLYYQPNPYTLTLDGGAGWATLPATWKATHDVADGNKVWSSYATGHTLPLPGTGDVTRPGYTLKGWTTDTRAAVEPTDGTAAKKLIASIGEASILAPGASFQLPANGDDALTLYAVWEPDTNTPYTVNHYKVVKDAQGNITITKVDTVTLVGTTDTAAPQATAHNTATEVAWKGYQLVADGSIIYGSGINWADYQAGGAKTLTVDGVEDVAPAAATYTTHRTGRISKANPLVLNLYYVASDTTSYQVERWILAADGKSMTLYDRLTGTGTTDTHVDLSTETAFASYTLTKDGTPVTSGHITGYDMDNSVHAPASDAYPAVAFPADDIRGAGDTVLKLFYKPGKTTFKVEYWRYTGEGELKPIDAFIVGGKASNVITVESDEAAPNAADVLSSYSATINMVNDTPAGSGTGAYYRHLTYRYGETARPTGSLYTFASTDLFEFRGYSFSAGFDRTDKRGIHKATSYQGIINPDGSTTFVLVYTADTLTLAFDLGTTGAAKATSSTYPMPSSVASETLVTLPVATDVDRPGYKLVGWTTDFTYTFAADAPAYAGQTVTIADAKGFMADALYAALKGSTSFYTNEASHRYTMSTASGTLHAVWVPTNDTAYTVDVYKVRGDGTMVLVGTQTYADGTADEPVHPAQTKAEDGTYSYDGSLHQAKAEDGTSKFALDGYAWAAPGDKFAVLDDVTTLAFADMPTQTQATTVIAADGSTHLAFIFQAQKVTYYVARWRVDGDGNTYLVGPDGKDVKVGGKAVTYADVRDHLDAYKGYLVSYTGYADAAADAAVEGLGSLDKATWTYTSGWTFKKDSAPYTYQSHDNAENVDVRTSAASPAGEPNASYNATYDTVNFGQELSSGTVSGTGNTVLSLFYTPATFKVRIDANGGSFDGTFTTGTPGSSQIVWSKEGEVWSALLQSGTTVTLPTYGSRDAQGHKAKDGQITRVGYVLEGFTTQIGGEVIPGTTFTTNVGAVTLYAKWASLNVTYTVTYVKVHGDGTQEVVWFYQTEGMVDSTAQPNAAPTQAIRQGITIRNNERGTANSGAEFDWSGYDFVADKASYTYLDFSGASQTVTTKTNRQVTPDGKLDLYLYYQPKTDVAYYVERWLLTGDGKLSPLDKDGKVLRDADGRPIVKTYAEVAANPDAYRIVHHGWTDAMVYADGTVPADASKGHYNLVDDRLAIDGYTYLGHGLSWAIKGTSVTTDAHENLNGDGTLGTARSQVLRLFFYADTIVDRDGKSSGTLTFEAGDKSPAGTFTESHLADATFTLPVDDQTVGTKTLRRDGYELAGWSTQKTVFTGGKYVDVNTASGKVAFDVIAALEKMNVDASRSGEFHKVYYLANGSTLYQMPVLDATLYAVWKPILVTYTVEVKKVTGDGDVVTLSTDTYQTWADVAVHADEAVPEGMTANQYGYVQETGITYLQGADKAHYLADKSQGIANYLAGYTYAEPSATAHENEYGAKAWSVTTDSRHAVGSIEGASSTTYTLYYLADEIKVTLDAGAGAWNTANTDVAVAGGHAWSMKQTQTFRTEQTITLAAFGAQASAQSAQRTGYTLVGWARSADGSKATGKTSQTTATRLAALTGKPFYEGGKLWTTVTTWNGGTNYTYGYQGADAYEYYLYAQTAADAYTYLASSAITYLVPSADVTLHAVWRADSTTAYTVQHIRYDGQGNAKDTITDTLTGITDESYTLKAYAPEAGVDPANYHAFVGYTFNGDFKDAAWKSTADDAAHHHVSTLTPAQPVSASGTTTYLLFYKADDITLTLEKGAGTWVHDHSSEKHQTESLFALPSNGDITRTGYTLVGWSFDPTAQVDGAAVKVYDSIAAASQAAADSAAQAWTTSPRAAAEGGALYTRVATTQDGRTYVTSYDRLYTMPTTATTLYAVWRANNNSVTYKPGQFVAGGDVTQTHPTDQVYYLPDGTSFQRGGYTLVGWTTTPTYSKDGNTYSVNESKGKASQTMADAIKVDATPDSPASGAFFTLVDGTPETFTMPTDKDITLYAVWRANSDTDYYVYLYKVTGDGQLVAIDKDGNEVTGASLDANNHVVTDAAANRYTHQGISDEHANAEGVRDLADQEVFVTSDNVTIAGYDYILDADTTGVLDKDGIRRLTTAAGTISGNSAAPLRLVLIYKAHQNTLHLVLGGSTDAPASWNTSNTDGAAWSTTPTTDDTTYHKTVKSQETIALPAHDAVSRPGYTLVGWALGSDANANEGLASQRAAKTLAAGAGHASFENGGKGWTGATWTLVASWNGTDYVFTGTQYPYVYQAAADITYLMPTAADLTLYAVWRANSDTAYTVTTTRVDGNGQVQDVTTHTYTGVTGETAIADKPVGDLRTDTPWWTHDNVIPTGYQYVTNGTTWTVAHTDASQVAAKTTQVTTTSAGKIKLAADGSSLTALNLYFVPLTKQITFDAGSGSFAAGKDKTGTYGTDEDFLLPDAGDLTRKGYTFIGWSAEPKMTADGKAIAVHTSKGADSVKAAGIAKDYAYDEATAKVRGQAFTKPGDPYKVGQTGEAYTLYAVWQANSYKVTYVDGKAGDSSVTGGRASDTYYTDDVFALPADLARDGYTFMGWTSEDHVTIDGSNYVKADRSKTTVASESETISKLKGTDAQGAWGQVHTRIDKTADGGAVYTGLRTTTDGKAYTTATTFTYTMSSADETLYAVWYANNKVTYTIERWIVSGDGNKYAMAMNGATKQGTIQRDGKGLLTADTTAHTYTYLVGTADEVAWADDSDGAIAYRNKDHENVLVPGYVFVADQQYVKFLDGTHGHDFTGNVDYQTIARALIKGDGTTKLVLFYQPLLNTLKFYQGTRTNTKAGAVTTVKLYTDETYTLPADYTRAGYELMGWTNQEHVSVDGTKYVDTNRDTAAEAASDTVSNLMGTDAQGAWNQIANGADKEKRTYNQGAWYTKVQDFRAGTAADHADDAYTTVTGLDALKFVMPSIRTDNTTDARTMTLYAVWHAHNHTPYYVERWAVSGDGTRYALTTDGELVRDANGLLVTSATADASHIETHYGITDEVAYADKTQAGVWYYVNDKDAVKAGTLDGYTYLDQDGDKDTWVSFQNDDASYKFENKAWKTVDHGLISGNTAGFDGAAGIAFPVFQRAHQPEHPDLRLRWCQQDREWLDRPRRDGRAHQRQALHRPVGQARREWHGLCPAHQRLSLRLHPHGLDQRHERPRDHGGRPGRRPHCPGPEVSGRDHRRRGGGERPHCLRRQDLHPLCHLQRCGGPVPAGRQQRLQLRHPDLHDAYGRRHPLRRLACQRQHRVSC